MTSKEALLKLKEIAEHLTRKQWLELTSNIELIRNHLQKQEKLLDLYKQLVNENLQINLNVLEKIKEIENE